MQTPAAEFINFTADGFLRKNKSRKESISFTGFVT